MSTRSISVCVILVLAGLFNSAWAASAIVIDHRHGLFNMAGGYSNAMTGQKYYAGTVSSPSQMDVRDFYVFSIPIFPDAILGGKMLIHLPKIPSPPTPGYITDDPSETYRLSDTGPHGAAHIMSPALTTPEAIDVWDKLGTGTHYGSATITAAMADTDIEFTLTSDAIASLNASMGGFWVTGGRITTLDGSSPDEIVFAYSDAGAPHMVGNEPKLALVLAPEPSSLSLLAIPGLALLRRQRDRRSAR